MAVSIVSHAYGRDPSPVCWPQAVLFSVLQTSGPKLVGTLCNFVTLVMKFGSRPVMETYYLLAHGEVHSKLYSHFIKASHSNCRVLLDWVPKQIVWSMRCSPLLDSQSDDCDGLCMESKSPPCLPLHTHFYCCKPGPYHDFTSFS